MVLLQQEPKYIVMGYLPSQAISYLKLNNVDLARDEVGNYVWTSNGVTYDNIGAYFSGSNSSNIQADKNLPDLNEITVAFRCKVTFSDLSGMGNQRGIVFFDGDSSGGHDFGVGFKSNGTLWFAHKGANTEGTMSLGTWDSSKYYCIVVVFSSTGMSCYKNGQLESSNSTGGNANVGYHQTPTLGGLYDGSFSNQNYKGWLSDFVISDSVWSANDVSKYFNTTKSLYGIS